MASGVKFIRKNGHVIPIKDKSAGGGGKSKPSRGDGSREISIKFSRRKPISAGQRARAGAKRGAFVGGVIGGVLGSQLGAAGGALGLIAGSVVGSAASAASDAAFGPRHYRTMTITKAGKKK